MHLISEGRRYGKTVVFSKNIPNTNSEEDDTESEGDENDESESDDSMDEGHPAKKPKIS